MQELENLEFYGNKMHDFAKSLWSINRSITGPGVRTTLEYIKGRLPELKVFGIKTGVRVYDWTVPQEWNCSEAYIVDPDGRKICDFSENNLHIVGYSVPVELKITLSELQKNLYSIPSRPNAIPYVTSYYEKNWGFCISENQRRKLPDGIYQVVIKSDLYDGELNYGELIIKGESEKEVLLSSYVCHPSMANNELSGPVVLTQLADWLLGLKCRRYTYRIIFVPETIGSITYISLKKETLKKNVVAGFNVTCVGDDRTYSFLPSRNGCTESDIVAKHVLNWIDPSFKAYTWLDRGSDERQYCAPGIDLPIASIMRSKYGTYPEYHTSHDDLLNVVTPAGLNGGYWALRLALELVENNITLKTNILCEPHLSKRGLYSPISESRTNPSAKLMLDLISYCDGDHNLVQIAEKLGMPAWNLYGAVNALIKNKIIYSACDCFNVQS